MAAKKASKKAAKKATKKSSSRSSKKGSTKSKNLQEKIFYKRESTWKDYNQAQRGKVFKFGDDYKHFISSSKTERMCAENVMHWLKTHGFRDIRLFKKLKSGDRFFKSVRGKAVFAGVVGKDMNQMRLVGSHMDSPRLDLKPFPLQEDSALAILKTHYYGGVKKFQWVNQPLALHGLALTKSGKKIDFHVGDNKDDPVFLIPDLLPHLARDQMQKTASKAIEGEEMSAVVGNIPYDDDDVKEQIKYTVLEHLHKEYGLIEEDFTVAELQFVPAGVAQNVGFDRSLIGAYGHDDKVCVYTSLRAIIDVKKPQYTAVSFFADKEEIGSMGNTGAASLILENFAFDYKRLTGMKQDVSAFFEHSKGISADVTSAMNPNHKGVQDPTNCCYVGAGIAIEKYGGGGGKYSTNDSHAEFMQEIRAMCDMHKIAWQTGENGRIDVGGGGTIAMYMSRYGMDIVDAGPAVLAMHAPREIISKVDVYEAYRFYKAFFE